MNETEAILETIEVTIGEETRKAELRRQVIDGTEFLSIWYTGDQTGEFKKQLEKKDTQSIRDQFEKMKHFGD